MNRPGLDRGQRWQWEAVTNNIRGGMYGSVSSLHSEEGLACARLTEWLIVQILSSNVSTSTNGYMDSGVLAWTDIRFSWYLHELTPTSWAEHVAAQDCAPTEGKTRIFQCCYVAARRVGLGFFFVFFVWCLFFNHAALHFLKWQKTFVCPRFNFIFWKLSLASWMVEPRFWRPSCQKMFDAGRSTSQLLLHWLIVCAVLISKSKVLSLKFQ